MLPIPWSFPHCINASGSLLPAGMDPPLFLLSLLSTHLLPALPDHLPQKEKPLSVLSTKGLLEVQIYIFWEVIGESSIKVFTIKGETKKDDDLQNGSLQQSFFETVFNMSLDIALCGCYPRKLFLGFYFPGFEFFRQNSLGLLFVQYRFIFGATIWEQCKRQKIGIFGRVAMLTTCIKTTLQIFGDRKRWRQNLFSWWNVHGTKKLCLVCYWAEI